MATSKLCVHVETGGDASCISPTISIELVHAISSDLLITNRSDQQLRIHYRQIVCRLSWFSCHPSIVTEPIHVKWFERPFNIKPFICLGVCLCVMDDVIQIQVGRGQSSSGRDFMNEARARIERDQVDGSPWLNARAVADQYVWRRSFSRNKHGDWRDADCYSSSAVE